MARRGKQVQDEIYEWAKDADILNPQGDPWAQYKYRYVMAVKHGESEAREAVKREIVEIARRMMRGMSTAEAFALKPSRSDEERWIDTRPVQKHEPIPKKFSAEDQFRARGMGIRLD